MTLRPTHMPELHNTYMSRGNTPNAGRERHPTKESDQKPKTENMYSNCRASHLLEGEITADQGTGNYLHRSIKEEEGWKSIGEEIHEEKKEDNIYHYQ